MASAIGVVAGCRSCSQLAAFRSATLELKQTALVSSPLNATWLRSAPGQQQSRLVVRASGSDDDDFEAKLATIRRRGGSGTGKKAELRKSRKEGAENLSGSSSAAASSSDADKSSNLLPPTPVKEQTSGGLPISLGFNAYSERLNGSLAGLGLAALISVELASGKSILNYHDASTIGVQLYFILAFAAVYIKWEKERRSVWPK